MTPTPSSPAWPKINLAPQNVIITATDTDAGKTVATTVLARQWAQAGHDVTVYKPVESGGPGDKDSDHYQKYTNEFNHHVGLDFDRPVSPHFEAKRLGTTIDIQHLVDTYNTLTGTILVEGAGGVLAPLSDTTFMSDLFAALKLPIVLVIKNRVGCLNHSLLTIEHLKAKQLPIAGLIINGEGQDNIDALKTMTGLEVLGVMGELEL